MAKIQPRIYFDNQAAKAVTIVTASSMQESFPESRVEDSRRSKMWRSATGWNIVAGVNDVLDFTEATSGAAQAVLTEGNFATGAALAIEITTQMNAVATDNTYLCTYSTVTTKFTIARATGTDGFDLLWFSGAGALFTVGEDIGFNVASDDTGLTTYVADNSVVKSSEWVAFDLGSAKGILAAIVLESNLDSAGTIKVQADAVGTFLSPSFEATLASGDASDPGKLLDFFASTETFQFWRIFIEDRLNVAGFSQLGIVFLGDSTIPSRVYDLNTAQPRQELSEITLGDQGAIFTDVKPSRRTYAFAFKDADAADKALWEEIANDRKTGSHLFYALDPLNKPLTHTIYGYTRSPGIGFTHLRSITDTVVAPVESWSITFPFNEAIG